MEYQNSGHHIHLVVYHLIFCPKNRRAVPVGRVAAPLEQIIRQLAAENKCEILELAIRPDHIHLFLRDDPVKPAYRIVRAVKGRSSCLLRQEFPHLRRLPSLWTHSYCYSTAGNVSTKTIQAYIEAQSGH